LRSFETIFEVSDFYISEVTSSGSGQAKTFLVCYSDPLDKFAVPVPLRYVWFTFIFQNKCISDHISIEIIIKISSIYATPFVPVCFSIIGGNDFIQKQHIFESF
jgi:hypothetical protein